MEKSYLISGSQGSGKTTILNQLKLEIKTPFCFDEVISVEEIEQNLKKANVVNKPCIIATQLYYKSIPLALLEKFTVITV